MEGGGPVPIFFSQRDDEQTWCSVDDILDDPKKKCWVASHTLCDGNQYVAEGSICKTGISSAVKCVDGQWKAAGNDKYLLILTRVRRKKEKKNTNKKTYVLLDKNLHFFQLV